MASRVEGMLNDKRDFEVSPVGMYSSLERLLTMVAVIVAASAPSGAGSKQEELWRAKWISRLMKGQLRGSPELFGVLDPEDKILATETIASIKTIRKLRNQMAHEDPATIEQSADVWRQLGEVFDELFSQPAELAHDLLPNWAAPLLQEYDKERWMVLQVKGSRLVYVDASGAAHPLLPGTVPALVKRFPMQAHHLPAVRRQLDSELEEQVADEVRRWEFVSEIDRAFTVDFNGRRLRPDILAMARRPGNAPGDALPVAVVEVKSMDLEMGVARFVDQLWTYAMACKVPFAVLTNGQDWHWYEVSEAGLEALDDGPVVARNWLESMTP